SCAAPAGTVNANAIRTTAKLRIITLSSARRADGTNGRKDLPCDGMVSCTHVCHTRSSQRHRPRRGTGATMRSPDRAAGMLDTVGKSGAQSMGCMLVVVNRWGEKI
ncbi:MAG TPA: hypothetical protein VGQ10_16290, partial [Vicinamibacterales bacterium]|nr:hypothetical protein [Vicinamibacterales bacterium]